MAKPSQKDLDKKAANLAQFRKKLNEDGSLTEKARIQLIRGVVRQVWMKAPNKLAFLEETRIADMDPTTRTKWLWKCEICEGMFKGGDIQVDHIVGEAEFTSLDHLGSYCEQILGVGRDGMQILCIPDHEIKTLQERMGITFEEARIEKKTIAWAKQKAADQVAWFKKKGLEGGTNAKSRKAAYRKYLTEESNNGS